MITRSHTLHPTLVIALILATAGCGNVDESHARREAGTNADTSRIVTLGAGSLDAFLAAEGPAVIEFGGKRCIPCMEMRDILEDVGELRPDVRLGIVFWEDDPELFKTWDVPLIPAQIVFDDAREVVRHRGTWERDSLLSALGRHFPESNSGH